MQELLTLLTKNAMLPVAIFTFSKKKCDGGADALSSSDLTTSQVRWWLFCTDCGARCCDSAPTVQAKPGVMVHMLWGERRIVCVRVLRRKCMWGSMCGFEMLR